MDILQYDQRLKSKILRLASEVNTDKNPVSRKLSKRMHLSLEELKKMFLDKKYRYEHQWSAGDLILVDNFRYLHGRNPLEKY